MTGRLGLMSKNAVMTHFMRCGILTVISGNRENVRKHASVGQCVPIMTFVKRNKKGTQTDK